MSAESRPRQLDRVSWAHRPRRVDWSRLAACQPAMIDRPHRRSKKQNRRRKAGGYNIKTQTRIGCTLERPPDPKSRALKREVRSAVRKNYVYAEWTMATY
jgi:hypothetical protein